MADLNRNGIDDYFERPSYEEELNQYMMGTGGFGAPSDKVYVPSFGQPAFRTTEALLAMPNAMEVTPSGMDYNSSLFPDTDYFSSTYTPSFEGLTVRPLVSTPHRLCPRTCKWMEMWT